eukprot:sb/3475054/
MGALVQTLVQHLKLRTENMFGYNEYKKFLKTVPRRNPLFSAIYITLLLNFTLFVDAELIIYLYYKLEMNVVEVVRSAVSKRPTDPSLNTSCDQSFPIVTNSVAMATVLLTLKGAKRTARRSRVGYRKAVT